MNKMRQLLEHAAAKQDLYRGHAAVEISKKLCKKPLPCDTIVVWLKKPVITWARLEGYAE